MNDIQLIEEAARETDAAAAAEQAIATADRALVAAVMQSGVVAAGKDNAGWRLLDGNGARSYEMAVTFPEAFRFFPTVRVMLSGLDILDGANHRLGVFPTNVTKGGFTLVFHTWSDTRVWSAAATWIAHST